MQWTKKRAHLLVQARTKVLNEEWEDCFRQQYPSFRSVPAEPMQMAALTSKRALKAAADARLLRESCADQPDHADLIEQVMQVLHTTALLPGGKRGRRAGVERVLDAYLRKSELVAGP